MIEHPYRSAGYRPHAVRVSAQPERFAHPMAVRATKSPLGVSSHAWQPSEAPGFRAAVWRMVLNVVQTMWAE
jgi:hypothetical protein